MTHQGKHLDRLFIVITVITIINDFFQFGFWKIQIVLKIKSIKLLINAKNLYQRKQNCSETCLANTARSHFVNKIE